MLEFVQLGLCPLYIGAVTGGVRRDAGKQTGSWEQVEQDLNPGWTLLRATISLAGQHSFRWCLQEVCVLPVKFYPECQATEL